MTALNKKTVDDINVKGKKVLVRCDFNVPLKNGVITDENRIVAALPTIKKLIADGGKVILCSHLGKPKGEAKPELSLAPVAKRLSELLEKEVVFAADDTVVGENAQKAVAEMNDGDVVLLQNTRYRAEETKNGEALSKELASLCEVYVNDALQSKPMDSLTASFLTTNGPSSFFTSILRPTAILAYCDEVHVILYSALNPLETGPTVLSKSSPLKSDKRTVSPFSSVYVTTYLL